MKTINQVKAILVVLFLFVTQAFLAQNTLRVMKMGLGDGTVNSTAVGIDCGGDCDQVYANPTRVTLTATADAFSTFDGWEGDITSSATSITINVNQYRSIRAKFSMRRTIYEISDFTPEGIRSYLDSCPHVNTPAKFLKALPQQYKWNWILMTRSESLQTGTAEIPRIILPSEDAQFVFTIGLGMSSSYPGSHPDAIEYMQWDATEKTFRMHEIVLQDIQPIGAVPYRTRGISIDDTKCAKCHSTRNVINKTRFRGTSPRGVIPKSRPNWDAYDSWAGMLPFNRDAIYQGSVEATAFRKLFNFWTWRDNAPVREVIEQLELQPPRIDASDAITRINGQGQYDSHIQFRFDGGSIVTSEPQIVGARSLTTNYSFNGAAGTGTATTVQRNGDSIVLRHSRIPTHPAGEGRGVRLFDALGGLAGDLNQKRVADELIQHRFATGSYPIDVRPIALAIIKDSIVISGDTARSRTATRLNVDFSFFASRISDTRSLQTDTGNRTKSLPRRKADFQKMNFDKTNDPYTRTGDALNGLIQEYGDSTFLGTSTDMSRLRQEIFRRDTLSRIGFRGDQTVMDSIYVDRENYNPNTNYLTLFRYFLEPLGVSVDQWSINVRSRSLTYAFADIFGDYKSILRTELTNSLTTDPIRDPVTNTPLNPNGDLIKMVNITLGRLPNANAIPTYTDIQRIFNKACIECHGGLRYPPYENYGTALDLSENEYADGINGNDRLKRSYDMAVGQTTDDPATSRLYQRIINPNQNIAAGGMMPMYGPPLSEADIKTIRRWIEGTPSRPYTHGDPHIGTVNGIRYDFQAAGEFTMLKAQNVELQTRQTPIETARPLGPNPHTGLTSCVTINTAFAMRVGSNRITFQPSAMGEDGSEMQLRLNGRLQNLTQEGIELNEGGRILPSGPSGIQIEAQGNIVVITPGWWSSHKLWYLNIDIRHIRAKMGVMGEVLDGNWLPALPDGTELGPRPKRLEDRYNVLYNNFAEAWRVTDETSLFDYAEGTSTDTFTLENWPAESSANCEVPDPNIPMVILPAIDRATAELRCGQIRDDGRRENCIEDLIITGEVSFAETYLIADRIDQNIYPEAPKLVFPLDHAVELSLPIEFKWDRAVDEDGDFLTYKYYVWDVNETMNNNKAEIFFTETTFSNNKTWIYLIILVVIVIILWWRASQLDGSQKSAWRSIAVIVLLAGIGLIWSTHTGNSLTKKVSDLASGKAYFWKVIVEDGNGGTTESETYRFEVK
jgi:mono/diheme cytochrome c family protein